MSKALNEFLALRQASETGSLTIPTRADPHAGTQKKADETKPYKSCPEDGRAAELSTETCRTKLPGAVEMPEADRTAAELATCFAHTLTAQPSARPVKDRLGLAPSQAQPLEAVLKGHTIELWSDLAGERLFIVADEEDAAKLGEPRGQVYTAPEVRRIVSIRNPELVAEIHRWKATFLGRLREGEPDRGRTGT